MNNNKLILEDITIAILAKDKGKCLPLYLECILNQTYPKHKTHLYIRTNNNTDNTVEILIDWINKYGHLYKSIYFDREDVIENITQFKNHEWNSLRFSVMSRIRQESIDHALKMNSHYFVADCDNFIVPDTIENLFNSNKNIIGPLLHLPNMNYSNYHHSTNESGYYKNSEQYFWILDRKIKGIIEVDVIHCTYFIRKNVLSMINYFDNTTRHEYVIFSDNCRKKNLKQYIDNQKVYGFLTFLDDASKYEEEEFRKLIKYLEK